MNEEIKRPESPVPRLMLFVTGNAPRSVRARKNLADALDSLDLDTVKPMEIDLLSQPEQTVAYSVFATPALLKTEARGKMSVLYGDLSDEGKLQDFLQNLPEASS